MSFTDLLHNNHINFIDFLIHYFLINFIKLTLAFSGFLVVAITMPMSLFLRNSLTRANPIPRFAPVTNTEYGAITENCLVKNKMLMFRSKSPIYAKTKRI